MDAFGSVPPAYTALGRGKLDTRVLPQADRLLTGFGRTLRRAPLEATARTSGRLIVVGALFAQAPTGP
jgi:hypothetical protein